MTATRKKCRKCGELKGATHFNVRWASRDGLQNWCRSCHNPVVYRLRAKAKAKA